jgi:hypothetical protein
MCTTDIEMPQEVDIYLENTEDNMSLRRILYSKQDSDYFDKYTRAYEYLQRTMRYNFDDEPDFS